MLLREKQYIQDLSRVVNEYIPQVYNQKSSKQLPEGLKSIKSEMIFGNIESIFEWHKNDFLPLLQRCLKNPNQFGLKMEEIEKTMLSLYLKYFKNIPVSKYIVKLHESYFRKVSEKIGNSFEIKSYLQLPIDRIFKYKLLFCSILEHAPEYESELQKAIEVMERIMADVNNSMVLWRLVKFPEKIDDQGKLICYDPLPCNLDYGDHKHTWRISGINKPKRLQVFLLEGSIIFANINGEDNTFKLPSYDYFYHIKVSQIKQVQRHKDRIELKCEDPKRKNLLTTIHTNDKEMNTKWYDAITVAKSNQEKFKDNVLTPCVEVTISPNTEIK